MKKIVLIVVFLFAIQIVSAQDNTSNPQPNRYGPNKDNLDSDESIYSAAGIDVKPEYPGGMERFYKLIGSNFHVPTDKNFIPGRVYVKFVIEKDGSLSDIKVIRHLGFETDKEAIRVLNLSEKWLPAEQNGKKVRCSYVLPIAIALP